MVLSRKDVQARLHQELAPVLRDAAFEIFKGPVTTRIVGDRTDVLGIQFFTKVKLADWGLPANSFALDAGCFFSYLPRLDNLDEGGALDPLACHVRMTPRRRIWQFVARRSPNVWAVDERGRGLEKCVSDAVRSVRERVLPWFASFDSIERLNDMLLNAQEDMQDGWGFGNIDSPKRAVLSGIVAAKAGNVAVAREQLLRALESPILMRPHGKKLLDAAKDALSRLPSCPVLSKPPTALSKPSAS